MNRTVQHAPDKQALKAATKALVRAAGGQEAAAAFATRIKRQQAFADYGLASCDAFAPIDVIADLEAVTRGAAGWPHVTRALASMAGGAFVDLPQVTPDGDDWHDQISELAESNSGITRGLCAALKGDRRVTADEIRDHDLIGHVDELIADAVRLRAMLLMVEGSR